MSDILGQTHPWLTFSINLSDASPRLWARLGECSALCRGISHAPLMPDIHDALFNYFMVQSSMAYTALDAVMFSDDELQKLMNGTVDLPPSKKYLAHENENVVDGFRTIIRDTDSNNWFRITPEIIRSYNAIVLDRLVMPDNASPGDFRRPGPLGRRDGDPIPAEHIEESLDRLCEWLNSDTFKPQPSMGRAYGILRAVLAHLYLRWINPFVEGNHRTSQLVEFALLVSVGVPVPSASLLSLHFTHTRGEYSRRFDRASTENAAIMPFLMYAVQGLHDGLLAQCKTITELQAESLWSHHIHERFRDITSISDIRRRKLAIELSKHSESIPTTGLIDSIPSISSAYSTRTYKTLTRDVNELIKMKLVEKDGDGIRTRKDIVRAFNEFDSY
jgi:Fic family protein